LTSRATRARNQALASQKTSRKRRKRRGCRLPVHSARRWRGRPAASCDRRRTGLWFCASDSPIAEKGARTAGSRSAMPRYGNKKGVATEKNDGQRRTMRGSKVDAHKSPSLIRTPWLGTAPLPVKGRMRRRVMIDLPKGSLYTVLATTSARSAYGSPQSGVHVLPRGTSVRRGVQNSDCRARPWSIEPAASCRWQKR